MKGYRLICSQLLEQHLSHRKFTAHSWGCSSVVECLHSMYMALGSIASRKRKEKERTSLEASFRNPKAVVPERAGCFVY